MGIPIYTVDAFAHAPFSGNPAAVCLLEEPATEAWMQFVAAEMNLSETAFLSPHEEGGYGLRWFTPAVEVDLCGHATLASSHVLWESGLLNSDDTATFHTRVSGVLQARRLATGEIELDFPSRAAEPCSPPPGLFDSLGVATGVVGRSRDDYLVELQSADDVRVLQPDFRELSKLAVRGVICTATSDITEYDFISRFFAPAAGVDEDPVTGSAHCCLSPYWAVRLGKANLIGFQASTRGGVVGVRVEGNRVALIGRAFTVLSGHLHAV